MVVVICLSPEKTNLHVALLVGFHANVSLLHDAEAHTLGLRQACGQGSGLAKHEDILLASGKAISSGIAKGDDVEGSWVSLERDDVTNTTRVAPLGDHSNLAGREFDKIHNLARSNVDLHDIIDLDKRIGVTDGASIVSHHIGDLLQGGSYASNTTQLVGGLSSVNLVKDKFAFRIEDQTEGVVGLGDFHHVHKSNRVVHISANLTIYLDKLLHADLLSLLTSQGVLQSITKNEDDRKTLTKLVRALRGARGPDAIHLGKHPMLGRIQALKMFNVSTSHFSLYIIFIGDYKIRKKEKGRVSIPGNCPEGALSYTLDY